jgi:hypothetical protein
MDLVTRALLGRTKSASRNFRQSTVGTWITVDESCRTELEAQPRWAQDYED